MLALAAYSQEHGRQYEAFEPPSFLNNPQDRLHALVLCRALKGLPG
jgi:hypothetical protein